MKKKRLVHYIFVILEAKINILLILETGENIFKLSLNE